MDTDTDIVVTNSSATTLAIESDDIHALYKNLTTQADNLVTEFQAFAHFISCQPTTLRPKIALSKFQNDIEREVKLLHQHGAAMGFEKSQPPPPTSQPMKDESPTVELALRERSGLARSEPVVEDQPSSNIDANSSAHRIRSSNIIHLTTLWKLMKQCTGIQAVRKQMRYSTSVNQPPFSALSSRTNHNARLRDQTAEAAFPHVDKQRAVDESPIPVKSEKKSGRHEKEPVTVDIIAQNGGLWIKLYTKSLSWTVMDLAKEGCVDLSSSLPSSDDGVLSEVEDMMFAEIKLVKMAKEVLAAARSERFGPKHEHPKVQVHLTRISRGKWPDVDAVVKYVDDMGVEVIDANDLELPEDFSTMESFEQRPSITTEQNASNSSSQDLEHIFSQMLSSPPVPTTTETLNIDSTILITLISDISHLHEEDIVIPSHYHTRAAGKDIEKQLKSELTDPLLPNHIYPILSGKRLVCTTVAAAHVRNLVDVMGSSTETKRSRIFLPIGPQDMRGEEELVAMLDSVTQHDIPYGMQLPIRVIEGESDGPPGGGSAGARSLEEEVMERVARHPRLSTGNRSVLFHGWRQRITTVSLNRVISDWLSRAIDATLNDLEAESDDFEDVVAERGFVAPHVLICGRERSLLGSEFSS